MTDPSASPAPAPAGALALLARQGAAPAGPLAVTRPVVTLGRGAQADVQVADDSVSGVHCRLEFAQGTWRITDLHSTNGTAVDGARLAPEVATPLPYGAAVRLGGVTFRFQEVAGADPDAARATFTPPPPAPTLRQERRGGRFPLWMLLLVLLLAAAAVFLALRGAGAQVPAAPAPAASSAEAATSVPAPAP
jgi:pSer/pThr/pTyr-binding forkhead associated (FHA) protein